MGYGKDFLLDGRFGVIRCWTRHYERYHEFQVGPIHGLASLAMYGLGFWYVGYMLPPPPGRPLPSPPRGPLPGGPLPPMPKGPPPPLLIGTVHPFVSGLLASPIRDGFPL